MVISKSSKSFNIINSVVASTIASRFTSDKAKVLEAIAYNIVIYGGEEINAVIDKSLVLNLVDAEIEDIAGFIYQEYLEDSLSDLLEDWREAVDVLYQMFSKLERTNLLYLRDGVSKVFGELSQIKSGDVVYTPFSSDYEIMAINTGAQFFGSKSTSERICIDELYRCAHNIINYQGLTFGDSRGIGFIEQDFDVCEIPEHITFSYIPFLPQTENLDEEDVDVLCNLLDNTDRMFLVIRDSVLNSRACLKLRERIIGYIEKVVTFKGSSIYYNGSGIYYALYIDNNHNLDRFDWIRPIHYGFDNYDMVADMDVLHQEIVSGEYSCVYTIEQSIIYSNHERLLFTPLTITDSQKTPFSFQYLSLWNLLEKNTKQVLLEETSRIAYLSSANVRKLRDEHIIEANGLTTANAPGTYNMFDEPSLCLTFKGGVSAVWCNASKESPVLYENGVYVYSLKSKDINPEYLMYMLYKECVLDLSERSFASVYYNKDKSSIFLDCEIPVPCIPDEDTLLSQERILSATNRINSKTAEQEIRRQISNIEESIVDRIHLGAPYGQDVQQKIYRLKKLLERKGSLNINDFVDGNLTVLDYLNLTIKASERQGKILANMGKPLLGEPSTFDCADFLLKYCEEQRILHPEVLIECLIEGDVNIRINRDTLESTLDNIFRNAIIHGFTNYEGPKKIQLTLSGAECGETGIISIANSGNRVADGFSKVLYARKGGMCGPYATTGRGGKFVNDVMDFYGGYFNVKTDDSEWSFIISLFIPVVYDKI